MDIENIAMKRQLLQSFMNSNSSGTTTKNIIKATGFTEEELIYSNNLVKQYPQTFWDLEYYEYKDGIWKKNITKNQEQEIKRLKSQIESLTRENNFLRARLEETGMSKSNL